MSFTITIILTKYFIKDKYFFKKTDLSALSFMHKIVIKQNA